MSDRLCYDVVVIGGGPAGLTTALYTTRLGHRTAVFEKEGGRHATVSHVHNLFGVSEDVSGQELAKHAVEQFVDYGGDYYFEPVSEITRPENGDGGFVVTTAETTVESRRVVLATGFSDREPDVPEIQRFGGRGLHYCLHCDAYTLGGERVFVLGHDDHAATVAMLMLNFTADVELLLDGHEPSWSEETERQLQAHPVDRINSEVVSAFADDETPSWLGGLQFADRDEREYLGGFAMYGKEYNTTLAESIGCELADDGAIAVDDSYETTVDGVYAVGDVTHGQNQTVVAMGDGARAGMAVHKTLRRYPVSVDELDSIDEQAVPAVPDDLRARMRLVRERETHPGLGEPSPNL